MILNFISFAVSINHVKKYNLKDMITFNIHHL